MLLLLLVWITRNFSNTEYDSPLTGRREHCGQLCTTVGTVESHSGACGLQWIQRDSQLAWPTWRFVGGFILCAIYLLLLAQLGNESLNTGKC